MKYENNNPSGHNYNNKDSSNFSNASAPFYQDLGNQPPAYTSPNQYPNLSHLPSSPSSSFYSHQTPPFNNYNNNSNSSTRFAELVNKYEISRDFSDRLQKYLNSTKIVYIFDDSGSMNSILNDSPLNTGLMKATRWDELKNFSRISIDLANIFNPNGIDIFFLNRPPARNVKNMNDLEPYFVDKPAGFTPLKRVLDTVLVENNRQRLGENKLLVIIVTDGQPTDDMGREDIRGFKRALKSRDSNVYTTIVSCTGKSIK
jgi:hypothetical protein